MSKFDAELPPRDYYRRLAATLVVNGDLWDQFQVRCRAMAAARAYGHKQWETVAATVMKGYSLGMGFMESMTKLRFLDGNPVLRGSSAVAHIHAVVPESFCRCLTTILRRDMAEAVEGDEGFRQGHTETVQWLLERYPDVWQGDRLDESEVSVWLMGRPGWDDMTYIYTRDQAEDSGLLEGDFWHRFPERSLKWQTASTGTQEMFGDVLEGLYLAEEFDHGPRRTTAPEVEPAQELGEPPTPDELSELGEKMRGLGVTYAQSCDVFLGPGHALGTGTELEPDLRSAPDAAQFGELSKRVHNLEDMAGVMHRGGTVDGYSIRAYPSSYERYRPAVQFVGPHGDEKRPVSAWAGSLRNSEADAKWYATRAAVQFLMLGRPELEPADEQPDEDTRARVDAALTAESDKNAARNKAAGSVVYSCADAGDLSAMMADAAKQEKERLASRTTPRSKVDAPSGGPL